MQCPALTSSCGGARHAVCRTSNQPQLLAFPRRSNHRCRRTANSFVASAAAAGWPSRDPRQHNSSSNHSNNTDERPAGTPIHPSALLVHPLVSVLAAVLLAVQEAAGHAAAAARSGARRIARAQVWLGKPEALLFREGCQLLACMVFILLYVWSTYSPVVHGSGRWWLDLLLSALFAADYVHRTMTSSRHPLLATLHPLALIDLLSFAPSLLGVLLPDYMAPWGWDLRWFRVFRALRLLRLSLLSGNLSTMKTNRGVLIAGNLNVPLVWLVASVVAWMFTSASCVAVMEKLPWHDALYFVGSTLTTVGYGDVVVRSSAGRLFVLIMMLVGVVLIPVRAGQLYSRLAERLLVAGHKPGDAPGCAGGYLVLSGRLSDVRGFNDFLQDFLVQVRNLSAWSPAPSRGRQGLQLVCLCNKPSVEFLALQELHESHLTLVEGSAFSERDLLHRAGLPASLGAFVLADRFSSNATAEDTDVQFRVWAIKSAVKRLPLYVQVLRRSSVDVISPFLDPYLDVIMSVEGTRMRLLALSSLVPGASTLIANLLRSSGPNAGFPGGASSHVSSSRHLAGSGGATRSGGSSPTGSVDSPDDWPLGFGLQKLAAAVRSLDDVMISHPYQKTTSKSSSSSSQGPSGRSGAAASGRKAPAAAAAGAEVLAGRRWLREYADGSHCELFMVPAGPPLAGLRFTGAAQAVYEASGALLVGLIEVGSQRLLLNASSHTVHQEQQLVVLAPTYRAAQAAAAGAGVEAVLYSQALEAAQEEATAAAAAVLAAHEAEAQQLHEEEPVSSASTSTQQQQQEQQQQQDHGAVGAQESQLPGQLPAPQSPSVTAGAASAAASNAGGGLEPLHASSSSSGSSSAAGRRLSERRLHGSMNSMDGSRSVTVRVPESLASELARSSADRAQTAAASSSRKSSSGGGSSSGHVQQRQCVEQQPQLHLLQQQQQHPHHQQQQQQQQPFAPAVAGAAFAAEGQYADAYAAFHQQQRQQLGAAAAAAAAAAGAGDAGPGLFDNTADDDDLVSGCLAPWSGAFESDSLDETELCTDSEMLEAALLQRQRQQEHAERLQQQQQQWLTLSSYDSSSAWKQQSAASTAVPQQEQQQGRSRASSPDMRAHTSSSSNITLLPAGSRHAQAAGLPLALSAVSVTSITAAALDQHIQQRQQHGDDAPSQTPQGAQLQQQAQGGAAAGPESVLPPAQLHAHFIVAGCASSFVQFARQLAASASPACQPLTVVLLHPEYPGAAVEAIRRMGVVAHYVSGRSSDAAALLAAGAKSARSLVYVGPSERPTNLPVMAVSGVYGDPTSTQAAHADLSGSSRTAVLADADALSSCYGVGEVFLPDSLSTIVELGFTSSIRFLQPGLLLHGRPAPHSSDSVDGEGLAGPHQGSSKLLGNMLGAWSEGWAKLWRQQAGGSDGGSGGRDRGSEGSMDEAGSAAAVRRPGSVESHPLADFLPMGSRAVSRSVSPDLQHDAVQQQQQQRPQMPSQVQQQRRSKQQRQQQQKAQRLLSWPWQQHRQPLQQQQHHTKLPRSSWRHRKEIEEAGQLEGLTEWQLNSYYAAGRVMVPALLDVFTCQGFFKRQALLDLLTELAGDDGRPGGAMLQQQAVPSHLVGCCYYELVSFYLSHPDPLQRFIPLGLLRRKAENRAWRLPYVATHPHPDTLLQAADIVFVIRPQ